MTFETFMELVGYFASLLVLVSLLMTSVVKLRIINSIGSAIYVIYALCIGSYPTAVMNLGLVLINAYFLIKLSRHKTMFHMVEAQTDESATNHFLQVYRNDIHNFFPGYDFTQGGQDRAYFIYADGDPVGLLIGRELEEGVLGITLDYSTPRYRDCSVGSFLYGQLAESGIKQLVAQGGIKAHEQYMQKMGFVQKDGRFIKDL